MVWGGDRSWAISRKSPPPPGGARPPDPYPDSAGDPSDDFSGGDDRNRTGVHGFAIRCVTTPPRRRQEGWVEGW